MALPGDQPPPQGTPPCLPACSGQYFEYHTELLEQVLFTPILEMGKLSLRKVI